MLKSSVLTEIITNTLVFFGVALSSSCMWEFIDTKLYGFFQMSDMDFVIILVLSTIVTVWLYSSRKLKNAY